MTVPSPSARVTSRFTEDYYTFFLPMTTRIFIKSQLGQSYLLERQQDISHIVKQEMSCIGVMTIFNERNHQGSTIQTGAS